MKYNLAQIFICNGIGVILTFGIMAKSIWKLKDKDESRYLLFMSFFVFVSCIFEPLSFYVDGQEGTLYYVLNYIYNSWLYLANIIVAAIWDLFIITYLKSGNRKLTKAIVIFFTGSGFIGLFINAVHPFLFKIDKDTNVYHKEPNYSLYAIVAAVFVVVSLVFYLTSKNRKEGFKSLPILQSVLPVFIGLVIQNLQYGISIAWTGAAVALMILAISMQMDTIYIDKLTGVYNRFFLEKLQISLSKQYDFCLLMIDINGFKQINDQYGHNEGDRALKDVADILVKTMDDRDTVIRYAGDEFIVVINIDDLVDAHTYKNLLNIRLQRFNEEQGREYKLFVSIGYSIFNLKTSTIMDAMEEADKNMYKEKEEFYSRHDRRKD